VCVCVCVKGKGELVGTGSFPVETKMNVLGRVCGECVCVRSRKRRGRESRERESECGMGGVCVWACVCVCERKRRSWSGVVPSQWKKNMNVLERVCGECVCDSLSVSHTPLSVV